ncbi:MAG: DUF3995 domain-containing protein, partial [Acidimicrobiales bacterium]
SGPDQRSETTVSTSSIITATLFAILAIAHSLAGETGFIRPLVNAQWSIDEVPRWAANRLLRVAWHLTSVAWLAMAVITIDGTPLAAVSVAALTSALMMYVGLRGHPAWVLFLLAGLFGLHGEGWLPTPLIGAAVAGAVALAFSLAVVHLYWALGGRILLDAAVPTSREGHATISPGPVATLAVSALLLIFSGLVTATAITDEPAAVRWLMLAGVAVLAARAVGDGQSVGFTKSNRATPFADNDDRFFTPLAVLLGIGSTAALLL